MVLRMALLGACLLGVSPVAADELAPQQSVRFVEGKLFSYRCFNGAAGEGRILQDGSVVGNVQLPDWGRKLAATLPPGTVRVEDGAVCAHIAGLFIRPCFDVNRIDDESFRGSIAGMDFAYCIFRRTNQSSRLEGTARELGSAHRKPIPLKSLNASSLY